MAQPPRFLQKGNLLHAAPPRGLSWDQYSLGCVFFILLSRLTLGFMSDLAKILGFCVLETNLVSHSAIPPTSQKNINHWPCAVNIHFAGQHPSPGRIIICRTGAENTTDHAPKMASQPIAGHGDSGNQSSQASQDFKG